MSAVCYCGRLSCGVKVFDKALCEAEPERDAFRRGYAAGLKRAAEVAATSLSLFWVNSSTATHSYAGIAAANAIRALPVPEKEEP